MATKTITTNKVEDPPAGQGGDGFDGFGGDDGWGGGGDGSGDGNGGEKKELSPPLEGYGIAIRLTIVSIAMLFLALSSAYVFNNARVQPLAAPPVLWVSTIVILASSITIEVARRALRRRMENRFRFWITVTAMLGLFFLAAQIVLWRQLVARGFYVNKNLHSGYAYVFTGLHGAHLIGGLIALFYVVYRDRRTWTAVRRRVSVDAAALYWHFLDGLWVYLLIILFFWR
jgi:cytochrome c oxidase subunit 3